MVYGSCRKATSMLFWFIICVRLYVADRECWRFNCKHLMFVCPIGGLVRCAELMSLLVRVAIANSLCSVCILLTQLANLGSPYLMTNGSHILSPSCCASYNSRSLYIYADLWVFCSPSANALLHTKGTFPLPCTLGVYDYFCCTCSIFSPSGSLPRCISAIPFSI